MWYRKFGEPGSPGPKRSNIGDRQRQVVKPDVVRIEGPSRRAGGRAQTDREPGRRPPHHGELLVLGDDLEIQDGATEVDGAGEIDHGEPEMRDPLHIR